MYNYIICVIKATNKRMEIFLKKTCYLSVNKMFLNKINYFIYDYKMFTFVSATVKTYVLKQIGY